MAFDRVWRLPWARSRLGAQRRLVGACDTIVAAMSDEIGVSQVPSSAGRRLAPIRVGDATVFLEVDDDLIIESSDAISPVSFDPAQAFEQAGNAMSECVRVIGDRLAQIGAAAKPKEVDVEFTLTFEVEGKASIVPVLLTGKAKTASGIKVTAKWQP